MLEEAGFDGLGNLGPCPATSVPDIWQIVQMRGLGAYFRADFRLIEV